MRFKEALLISSLFIPQQGNSQNEFQSCPTEPSITGYCDHLDRWVPGMLEPWVNTIEIPTHYSGFFSRYDPGVMEGSLAYNDLFPLPEGIIDGIAIPTCNPDFIGRRVYVRIEEQRDWLGPFISTDCPHQDHMYSFIVNSEFVGEFGFKTAEAIGMADLDEFGNPRSLRGNIWAEVAFDEIPPQDQEPVHLRNWFQRELRFQPYLTLREALINNPDPRLD